MADAIGMSTTREKVKGATGTANPGGYVLPQPVPPVGQLVLPGVGSQAPRLREAEVAGAIGSRSTAMLECQQRLLGELRDSLQQCDTDLGEATRARLRGQLHTALTVLDWCDAVHADLCKESRWAAHGLHPVDLNGFLREVAGAASGKGVAIQVVGVREQPWWGDVAQLGETLGRAIDLVRARAGGAAAVVLELRGDRSLVSLRVVGVGDPARDPDPALVESFRQAVSRFGARVTPDDHGPGSPGFVLHLPAAD